MRTYFDVSLDGVSACICLPSGGHLERVLDAGIFYEADLLAALMPHMSGGWALDVGAHCGNHTAFFAHLGPVLAFEADNTCQVCWVSTVHRTRAKYPAMLVPHPVGPEAGRYEARSATPGRKSFMPSESGVAGVTIDEYALMLPKVDVIKMDIEGGEPGALVGAELTLAKHRPVLAVECKNEKSKAEVIEVLDRFGYTIGARYCATPTYLFHPPQESTQ